MRALGRSAEFATEHNPNPTKLMVGLVGYPNVGKSSTINALIGSKKVSVSATPGKTKHFQTLPFSDRVTLCDCPGLVFPQFVNTQADMVCDGVLPIDQMREASAPVELLVRRIPREILEGTYGIRIDVREVEGGPDDRWSHWLTPAALQSPAVSPVRHSACPTPRVPPDTSSKTMSTPGCSTAIRHPASTATPSWPAVAHKRSAESSRPSSTARRRHRRLV